MSYKSELQSSLDMEIIYTDKHIKECKQTVKTAAFALKDYKKKAKMLQKRKEWVENLPDDCE